MRDCAIPCALLCLLHLVLPYPLIKGKHDDTGTNLHSAPDPAYSLPGTEDRCSDEGFGAITLDDKGVMHYFRGDSVWMGFQGPTQPLNKIFPGMTGPVDAAFRNHNENRALEHQRTYLFKGSLVWSYFEGQLVMGYPRLIGQEFPGVPDNLDAAVECHRGECRTDSILFFKGGHVYIYSAQEEPPIKQRQWAALGSCTATVRWLGRYYCFNDIYFTRFDPVSGQVLSPRPLDARDYFVRCPDRGHGHAARQNATLMSIKDRCSKRSFEAFSSDDKSWTYAYRGGWFFRLDASKDGWHAWPLSHTWKNLQGTVDAVFNHENRMYFIQGSQVIVYISDQMYIPVLGYPKPIQEEWEVSGVTAVDAAFTCPHSSDLYLLRGNKLILVDLNTRKRSGEDRTIIHADVDSAMCNTHGLYLFHGQSFYHYKNVEELLSSKVAPAPGNIASYFMDC
ncbi:hemopexin [Bufo gargarizans]|uniref:hemopexin n=1 Tax=Bufo gargarizans TaxID=30331 RepID=UPI001CF541C1|nr:hemopexin [Bufo gargarizans]